MITATDSTTFASLRLVAPLLRALDEKAYTTPSPIQAQAIPHLLAGRDLMGCAQTGTGKTAAFALPILQSFAARPQPRRPGCPRCLVLTPTRELAAQIAESFQTYGRHVHLKHAVIFGGVGQQPQVRTLQAGVDVLVATPGRLLDLLQQGFLHLDGIEVFVLDEADRMLDMGFAPDVKRVIARLPARRQSLMFSATMPAEIRRLASSFLHDPVYIEVTPVATTAERINQRVCHVEAAQKGRLLVHTLTENPEGLVLVFSRTKHGANRLADNLGRSGIRAAAIHGNKSQGARQRALDEFRTGRTRVLVATDIAARGIDVKGISLVINYDLPNEPEAYVHRIGRTARAGAEGNAVSFCAPAEREFLRDIQRLIRQDIPVYADHPFALNAPAGRQQQPAPRSPAMQAPPHAPGRARHASPRRAQSHGRNTAVQQLRPKSGPVEQSSPRRGFFAFLRRSAA